MSSLLIIKFRDTSNGSVSVNSNNLLLRGCIIRNTDFIEGLVVYAGRSNMKLDIGFVEFYTLKLLVFKIS